MYYFISILFLPIWNTVLCVIIEFSSYSFLFDFLLRWISLFYKIKVCFSFCSSSSHELFTLFMLSSYFHVRIVTFMLSIRFLSSCVIYREAISRFDGTKDWFHFARLWMLLLFADSAHMWPCGRSNSLGMATGCGNSGTGGGRRTKPGRGKFSSSIFVYFFTSASSNFAFSTWIKNRVTQTTRKQPIVRAPAMVIVDISYIICWCGGER